MPGLNMSLISPSRLEHIGRSNTEAGAAAMSVAQKIVDFFRELFTGTSKEDTIKAIYNAIQDIKRSTSFDDAWEKFSALKCQALARHHEEFKLDLYQRQNNEWTFTLSIGENIIYSSDEVFFRERDEIMKAIGKSWSERLEQAFDCEDKSKLLLVLKEIAVGVNEKWSKLTSESEEVNGADERSAFAQEKMQNIVAFFPIEKQKMIYDQVTGEFGNRIRSVLGCAQDVISIAEPILPQNENECYYLLAIPTELEARFDSLRTILSRYLEKKEQKIPKPDEIFSKDLMDDERAALSSIGITEEMIDYQPFTA